MTWGTQIIDGFDVCNLVSLCLARVWSKAAGMMVRDMIAEASHVDHAAQILETYPCPPKEANWEDDGTDDHGWKSFLRYGLAMLDE